MTNLYELGVMSNKLEIEAENVDVAVTTLRIVGNITAPIAVYNSEEISEFSLMTDDKIEKFHEFVESHKEEIRSAAKKLRTF